MANINDWREAFHFLRNDLINELEHAGLQGEETYRIGHAIREAFKHLDGEIGNPTHEE